MLWSGRCTLHYSELVVESLRCAQLSSYRELHRHMTRLPEAVLQAWEDRNGPIVLTTVDQDGTPNAIYATCVRRIDDEHLTVADNFFSKTQANIKSGSKGSLLFITGEGKSYQVKGSIEYATSGEYFDNMKSWNGDLPGHAAAVLCNEEVYSGATKLA